MGAIIDLFAACLDELTGRNRCGVTDDSDEIKLAARLNAQNAKAMAFVMKCHSFHKPGNNLR